MVGADLAHEAELEAAAEEEGDDKEDKVLGPPKVNKVVFDEVGPEDNTETDEDSEPNSKQPELLEAFL